LGSPLRANGLIQRTRLGRREDDCVWFILALANRTMVAVPLEAVQTVLVAGVEQRTLLTGTDGTALIVKHEAVRTTF
jgi:hypothetical protein